MFNYFLKNKNYIDFINALKTDAKCFVVEDISDPAKIAFISSIECKKKLLIVVDELTAISFFNEYKFYDKDVYLFPEKDILFADVSIDNDKIYVDRMNIIRKIVSDEKVTVIASIQSIREKMQKFDNFSKRITYVEKNRQYIFEEFIKKLFELGYDRVTNVENINEFSIRGGIIDIFDPSYNDPIRIEFFGDDIESIRYFDLDTKRTINEIENIKIYPVSEDLSNELEHISIMSFFDEDAMVFFDELEKIKNKSNMIDEILYEVRDSRVEIIEDDENINVVDLYRFDELPIYNQKTIFLTSLNDASNENVKTFSIITEAVMLNKSNINSTYDKIKQLLSDSYKGLLVLNSKLKATRVLADLQEQNIDAYIINDYNDEINDKFIAIYVSELKEGFIDQESKFFLFTERDVYGIEQERKHRLIKKRRAIKEGFELVSSIKDLSIGDYVVHENYGVGIYRGLEHITTDDISKDYIRIEYADGGNLYVLVTKLEVIQKYASKNTKQPKLNSLNSREFIRAKNKVKEEVLAIAKELIEIYAKRKQSKGFKYSPDSLWQQEFEETFPYIETYDQLSAIDQVKADMESDKAMDRLICGDVGFGKTEVAIRAAFKAVQDNKQVAFLAPTTILTMQHFNTFKNRFKEYPVSIDYLSRFKSISENKKTVEKIKKGEIDIVIGTHRLLSDDVNFKDLGLLIIDEEQRFGVSHKEKIKKMKNDIDVLALSATPIPRTLYMSLNGIRDMSLLTEAPPDRMPIKTYVLKYNDELIKEAISRELNRDGQVFIVHNKIHDIYEFAEKISNLCKNANVAIAHGKLSEDELSTIMSDFIDGKYNVLVSTTIIETGIDIPNANTLIVDNAEDFGLSQLYQLRGRVGRSNRTAYAFFLYSKNHYLTEESEKRLKAIKEFKSLGSGIKIAMRDMEIRGAGNVLSLKQSGHLDAVGYELYVKLLNKAINYLSEGTDENTIEEKFINNFDTIVDIDINAYIPTEYIEDEKTKLDMYKKISKCEKEEQFKDIEDEMIDRFGKIPSEVENLLYIARLKSKANKVYISELIIKKDTVRVLFYEKAKITGESIVELIKKYNGELKFENAENARLYYRSNNGIRDINKMLFIANDLIENLKTY